MKDGERTARGAGQGYGQTVDVETDENGIIPSMNDNTPPTELGRYVLELILRFREKAEALMLHEIIVNKEQIKRSPAEILQMRDVVRPLLVQTFQQVEEELRAGKEPLLVLRNFLGPL